MMVLMVMMISSCRTIRQNDTQYISRTDTVYVDKIHNRLVHDSVFIHHHDSIFVNAYIDDDNVRHQDKEKYIYITKYKTKTDTVYIKRDSIVAKNDTIFVDKRTIEQPAKKIGIIRQIEAFLGTLLWLAVVLYVVLNFGRIKDFFRRLFG